MKKNNSKMKWTAPDIMKDLDVRAEDVPPVRSIAPQDLDIAFQPIIDLQTRELFAYEALTRCRISHYLSPLRLFDKASEQLACGYLGRTIREVIFAKKPAGRLFINLHPDELSSRWLVRPDDPICLHGDRVYLEITESAKFKYDALSFDVLNDLCARTGAQVVLDDVGTGYSNLNRLADYAPAMVKLDHSLTKDMDKYKRRRIMVAKMVELCEALGAKVVIENIETMGEFVAARNSGAHYGQGYFIGRPNTLETIDGSHYTIIK